MTEIYDYLIIGSGAGGSAAAYALAKAGKSVLLLEKGEPLPKDGSTLDIAEVIRKGRFKSKEPWVDKDGHQFSPDEYFNVGGKTKWYGAALLRYDPHEFEAEADFACLPWPISYPELEPYYVTAEELLEIRRFDIEPNLKLIVDKLRRNDSSWECRPLPLGLSRGVLDHADEAKHFDGFASVKGLKADAEHALLDRVRFLPNLELRTGQAVREFLPRQEGPQRVAGVITEDGQEFRGRTVLLAAGALHSPRLLQRYMEVTGLSRSLANYGQIGRYCKLHLLTALLAFSPSYKTDVLRKTALLLSAALPHSSIQPLGFDAQVIATLMPRFMPAQFANLNARLAYGFFLQTEDGSHADNRVVAERSGKQMPRDYPRLDYNAERLPLSRLEHKRLIRAFQRSLLRAGLVSAYKRIPLAGTAHACGTLVTGNDPAASVVDRNGKVHGMENLYVIDGSILPRSSRVNPSLTIYAWALRVAHLLTMKEKEHESADAGVHTVRARGLRRFARSRTPRVVVIQWPRRVRRGHRRRDAHAPLSRPADRARQAAAGPLSGIREGGSHLDRRRARMASLHQSLGERRDRAARLCAHRVVSSRRPHAGVDLRDRRSAPGDGSVDGTRRRFYVCGLPAAGGVDAGYGPATAYQAPDQR